MVPDRRVRDLRKRSGDQRRWYPQEPLPSSPRLDMIRA
ncbi:hypothetical protein SEA_PHORBESPHLOWER_32 [Gordonia phage PhorbesPhlower]|nr:hypothetical protein SEA_PHORBESPHLOWER_32 [Gordonia phage PhorbesPhlower]